MKIRNSLTFLLLLASCTTEVSDREYASFVKDEQKSGLHHATTVGQMIYDVQYMPSRLMLMQERLEGSEKDKREKQLEGVLWFTISIRCANSGVNPLKKDVFDQEEYNARLNYYLNAAMNDISLEAGGIRFTPISYLFENNYGLTGNETIIVAFETNGREIDDGATLSFEDKVFKNGIIKTFFPAEKLIQSNKI